MLKPIWRSQNICDEENDNERSEEELESEDDDGDYNQHMGGVDLLDSLIALYRTKIRSKKWYHRLFFHFLDMIVVTCWLLYKRHCKCNNLSDAEVMRLYAFKSYTAQGLCKSGRRKRKEDGPVVEFQVIMRQRRGRDPLLQSQSQM
ncbi:piggyBac transposable element-derived 3-like protein [Labeo rohita]|uniref:PiggyBac transposable element-derived 3-like protein n=1 Tax=Labeo rohita TaxID=84645 RepID=A0A498LTA7_LABRO|nr:piggyBac transposable element-derived 3-like protein [Labeo rohita]